MDELEISGKRFISSKRAAKENRYHVDYIGQLIRGGKVIGSKVGRAWYVDAESLAIYLGKEYKVPEKKAAEVSTVSAPVETSKISTPEHTVAVHMPTVKEYIAHEAPKLTYITEDEPLRAPTQQTQRSNAPAFKQEFEAQDSWAEFDQPKKFTPKPAKGSPWGVLVTLGAIGLLGALAVSTLFSYSSNVQGTEITASVRFTGVEQK